MTSLWSRLVITSTLRRYHPQIRHPRPPGEGPEFKPKYDNWRLRAKVPVLVLHHPPLDYQKLRLGYAVAASSCVPGLFEPLTLTDHYEGKTVRLVDVGVYDNQGIASLLEQDCNAMIVSDASGQMQAQDQPSGSRLGGPLRSSSISQSRVRQAQYRELGARQRSGLSKGLMFLHLKKDLESDPVNWRECQDPFDPWTGPGPGAPPCWWGQDYSRTCSSFSPACVRTSTPSPRSRPSRSRPAATAKRRHSSGTASPSSLDQPRIPSAGASGRSSRRSNPAVALTCSRSS